MLDAVEKRVGAAAGIAYVVSMLMGPVRWAVPGVFLWFALRIAAPKVVSPRVRLVIFGASLGLGLFSALSLHGGATQLGLLIGSLALVLVAVASREGRSRLRKGPPGLSLFVVAMTLVLVADVVAGKLLLGRASVPTALAFGVIATVLGLIWLTRREPKADRRDVST